MIGGCQTWMISHILEILFCYTSVSTGGCGRFFVKPLAKKKKDHDVNAD